MEKDYVSAVILTVLSVLTVFILGRSISNIGYLAAAVLSFLSIIILIVSNFKNEGLNGSPIIIMIIINILLTLFWCLCFALNTIPGGLS